MVKRRNKNNAKVVINQEGSGCTAKASKIGAYIQYEYCSERLSPFGGLLGLVKPFDLVRFKEIIDTFYKPPKVTSDKPATLLFGQVAPQSSGT